MRISRNSTYLCFISQTSNPQNFQNHLKPPYIILLLSVFRRSKHMFNHKLAESNLKVIGNKRCDLKSLFQAFKWLYWRERHRLWMKFRLKALIRGIFTLAWKLDPFRSWKFTFRFAIKKIQNSAENISWDIFMHFHVGITRCHHVTISCEPFPL